MGRFLVRAGLAAGVALVGVSPAAAAHRAAPSATTYRAQANAICKSEEQELNRLPHGLTLAGYLEDATAIARKSLEALVRLSPPSGSPPSMHRCSRTSRPDFRSSRACTTGRRPGS